MQVKNSYIINKDNKKEFKKPVKILIIGDSAIGKTNLLLRYTGNDFNENHLSTIGVDCKTKNIEVDDSLLKLQIWDTAGQERFHIITKQYYANAMGIILAYSITDRESFNNISRWIEQIKEGAPENVCLILIGNKCDIYTDRKVTYEEGFEMADRYNIPFFETSAREYTNVDVTFLKLSRDIKEKFLINQEPLKVIDIDQQIKIKQQKIEEQNQLNKQKKKNKQECC